MLSHRRSLLNAQIIVALCLAAAIDAVEDPYPTQHTLIGWFPSHIHHQIAFCSLQSNSPKEKKRYSHKQALDIDEANTAQLLKACGTTPATPTWKLLNCFTWMRKHLKPMERRFQSKLLAGEDVPDGWGGYNHQVATDSNGKEKVSAACKAKIKLLTRTDTVVVEKDTTENNEVRVVEETDAVVVENGALSSDASSGKGITPEKQTENVKNVEAGKTVEWNNRDETLAPTTNDLVEKIKEKEDIEEEEDKWLDVSPTKQ
ncbi:hypothetical protein HID58_079593 [Brassica napus]|uniref:Uncharacterized protein n=1 Tax=Brassica napus TaxID=3708 RepID=A0ABQ7Y2G0_BRANA|nr:hypothetical protein HID58_079593 [Brassica napus]